MPDGKNNFTTRLLSHNVVFTSFSEAENSNEDLVKKAGLQLNVNCSPYLAHIKTNLQIKVRADIILAQELDIGIPQRQNIWANYTDKCALKDIVQQIMEDRRRIDWKRKKSEENLKHWNCSQRNILTTRLYHIIVLNKIIPNHGS